MKAKYIRSPNCNICWESYPNEAGTRCKQCLADRTELVTVLTVGTGAFGNGAVICHEDGQITSCRLSELTIITDANGETP